VHDFQKPIKVKPIEAPRAEDNNCALHELLNKLIQGNLKNINNN